MIDDKITLTNLADASSGTSAQVAYLRQKIQDHSLTLFVGASVSANNMNAEPSYRRLVDATHWELEDIGKFLNNKEKGSVWSQTIKELKFVEFLDDFKIRYLGKREPEAYKYVNGQILPVEHNHILAEQKVLFGEQSLRHLRVELILLILHLTKFYNESVFHSAHFYFSLEGNSVDEEAISGIPPVAAECAYNVITILKDIRGIHIPPALEYENVRLIKDIFNGMCRELEYRYKEEDGSRIVSSDKGEPLLDSDHIKWLTDLLWLTFSVWLPFYPTSHELAIEMSVVSDDWTRTSKMNLMGNAECVTNPTKLAEFASRRFNRYLPNSDGSNKPCVVMRSHCDIAAIALYMSMTSSASNGIENPVVFTTNYDQGVEMAIEETIRQNNLSLQSCINGITSYRVLYPILAKANSALPIKQRNIGTDKQKFRLWWIARDWSYVSGEEPKICYQVVSELAPKDEAGSPSYPDMETLPPGAPHLHSNKVQELWTRNELTGRSEQVGGPILVKLHGSPLHFLPPSFEHFDATSLSSKTGADDCCICQDYLHFIVMSEHQYVNAIMKKSTFPLWAENMLAAPYKHILFMGYSMSDWNIRMQLGKSSEFVSNSGEKDNCTAIVIDPSDSERALLKRLGVDVMPRKLANFRTKLFGELPALHEISLKFPVLHKGTAK